MTVVTGKPRYQSERLFPLAMVAILQGTKVLSTPMMQINGTIFNILVLAGATAVQLNELGY
jgi:hypothetical protein